MPRRVGAGGTALLTLLAARCGELVQVPPEPTAGFFFQAEDGIRDCKVTGVQTCALPIWFPALLGGAVLPLGSMDRRAHHRQAGNRCPLASGRLPALLALPLARLVVGPAKDRAQRLRTSWSSAWPGRILPGARRESMASC